LIQALFTLWPIRETNIINARKRITWEISNKYGDQDFSLVDCTSFAIMERPNLVEVFSFDHHFTVFRPKSGIPFRLHPA